MQGPVGAQGVTGATGKEGPKGATGPKVSLYSILAIESQTHVMCKEIVE